MREPRSTRVGVFGGVLAGATASTPAAATERPSQEAAREALREALGDPRFDAWRRDRVALDAGAELLDRPWAERLAERVRAMLRSIGDRVSDFFDWLLRREPSPPGSDDAGWFDAALLGSALWWLGVLAGLLVLAGLAWCLYLLWARQRPRPRRPARPAALAEALDRGGALEAEADEWIDHAAGLAAEGEDLRLAYRSLYLALLAGLHRRGRIRFRPSRTNGAYVRGFRGPSAGTAESGDGPRASFAQLTTLFDDVWYGHEQPDPAGFPAVRARVERLLEASA